MSSKFEFPKPCSIHIFLKDKSVRIPDADMLEEPGSGDAFYIVKLKQRVIAKFAQADVRGWLVDGEESIAPPLTVDF